MLSGSTVTESEAVASRAGRAQRNIPIFVLLIAASFAFWWKPVVSTLELAFGNDAYTYILTIIPLSLALIYLRKKEVPRSDSSLRWAGWIVLVTALMVQLLGMWTSPGSIPNQLSVSVLGLVFFWIGSTIACFGYKTFRALLFPLCFLFLTVPLPSRAVDWMTETLQYQSAVSTTWLFHAARVPVTRDGVMLSLPTLDIEVARECSSIRSSTALVVITIFFAELFLRSTWRRALLVAIAIPLSVAKNAVRIFTIAELGTRVDPGYLNGRLHHHGGIVFLSLAVAVVVLLLWLLRRGETRNVRSDSPKSRLVT